MAIDLSKTVRKIKENLFWAFIYDIALITIVKSVYRNSDESYLRCHCDCILVYDCSNRFNAHETLQARNLGKWRKEEKN